MAFHTLKQSLHTLSKISEYQINNVLVYAVYAKNKICKLSSCTSLCNQLDVYTTILDLLDIKPEWKGIGHTLLQSEYSNSMTNEASRLSEWIIEGNYFSN